jgi:transcriptional regulator with GAF, ATPase, and Fis domain
MEVELLKQISAQIAIAVENALAYQEITGIKDHLAEANLYLENEIRLQHDFSGIIGDSPALKRVLQAVERFFWMKSAISRWKCSRSCCARCRSGNSSGWAAHARSGWTCA